MHMSTDCALKYGKTKQASPHDLAPNSGAEAVKAITTY
jgi:hypothetical protein